MLLDLCVVGSTVSYAHKLVGQRSSWSKAFRVLNNVVAVIDEVQSLGRLEVGGASAAFGNCIVVGDENQDCCDLLYSPSVSTSKPLQNSSAMLRKRSVIAWAKRNNSVHVLDFQKTMRYGQPLLQHLQQLFPCMSSLLIMLAMLKLGTKSFTSS